MKIIFTYPYGKGKRAVKFFNRGYLHVTGAKTLEQAEQAALYVTQLMMFITQVHEVTGEY